MLTTGFNKYLIHIFFTLSGNNLFVCSATLVIQFLWFNLITILLRNHCAKYKDGSKRVFLINSMKIKKQEFDVYRNNVYLHFLFLCICMFLTYLTSLQIPQFLFFVTITIYIVIMLDSKYRSLFGVSFF